MLPGDPVCWALPLSRRSGAGEAGCGGAAGGHGARRAGAGGLRLGRGGRADRRAALGHDPSRAVAGGHGADVSRRGGERREVHVLPGGRWLPVLHPHAAAGRRAPLARRRRHRRGRARDGRETARRAGLGRCPGPRHAPHRHGGHGDRPVRRDHPRARRRRGDGAAYRRRQHPERHPAPVAQPGHRAGGAALRDDRRVPHTMSTGSASYGPGRRAALSCALPPSRDLPRYARIAEELGYERLWVYDSPALYGDLWLALGRAAEATSRIGLASGVAVPSLRHVMVTASAIASVAELARAGCAPRSAPGSPPARRWAARRCAGPSWRSTCPSCGACSPARPSRSRAGPPS
ncbi:hypothetical protein FAGKG844_650011 [Frankia sp. AgKG'84/4]